MELSCQVMSESHQTDTNIPQVASRIFNHTADCGTSKSMFDIKIYSTDM